MCRSVRPAEGGVIVVHVTIWKTHVNAILSDNHQNILKTLK